MSGKHVIVSTVTVETELDLGLEELCGVCHITPDFIQELVAFGVIEPQASALIDWRFNEDHLRRVRMITHLQQDLEINLSGAALVIELMDEIERLRVRTRLLEGYIQMS